jgi:two-component system, OmpR family, response regulator
MGPVPEPSRIGRVLVVDDEPSIRDAVATALRYEGFDVEEVATGRAALHTVGQWQPDVVILDVMLPDINGIEVCRHLRAAGMACYVLFLTARDHLANKVTGLGAGGDDYITKPFSLAEVLAKTRAVMRRRAMPSGWPNDATAASSIGPGLDQTEANQRLACRDVVVDLGSHQVWRAGTPIHLTATEFRLLTFFLHNQCRVLSKQQILDVVWEGDFSGTPNIVEAYVGHLRRKLDPHGPSLIETIRLVGYVFHPGGKTPAGPKGEL